MDYELERAALAHISTGEKVLWSGQPRGGIRFRPADLFMVPFSLMWGGFAFFWEYSVLTTEGGNLFFVLWGIPFVLVGVYITVGRFFVDAWGRSRTIYLLTDQRIVIVSGILGREVKSLPLRTLPDFTLREHADGSGTITLGQSGIAGMFAVPGWPGTGRHLPPALEMIDRPRQVHEALRDAVSRSSTIRG